MEQKRIIRIIEQFRERRIHTHTDEETERTDLPTLRQTGAEPCTERTAEKENRRKVNRRNVNRRRVNRRNVSEIWHPLEEAARLVDVQVTKLLSPRAPRCLHVDNKILTTQC